MSVLFIVSQLLRRILEHILQRICGHVFPVLSLAQLHHLFFEHHHTLVDYCASVLANFSPSFTLIVLHLMKWWFPIILSSVPMFLVPCSVPFRFVPYVSYCVLVPCLFIGYHCSVVQYVIIHHNRSLPTCYSFWIFQGMKIPCFTLKRLSRCDE